MASGTRRDAALLRRARRAASSNRVGPDRPLSLWKSRSEGRGDRIAARVTERDGTPPPPRGLTKVRLFSTSSPGTRANRLHWPAAGFANDWLKSRPPRESHIARGRA